MYDLKISKHGFKISHQTVAQGFVLHSTWPLEAGAKEILEACESATNAGHNYLWTLISNIVTKSWPRIITMSYKREVETPSFLFNFYDHFTIRKLGKFKSQVYGQAQDQQVFLELKQWSQSSSQVSEDERAWRRKIVYERNTVSSKSLPRWAFFQLPPLGLGQTYSTRWWLDVVCPSRGLFRDKLSTVFLRLFHV